MSGSNTKNKQEWTKKLKTKQRDTRNHLNMFADKGKLPKELFFCCCCRIRKKRFWITRKSIQINKLLVIFSFAYDFRLNTQTAKKNSDLPLFCGLDLILLENSIIAIYTHDQATNTHSNHKIFLGFENGKMEESTLRGGVSIHVCMFA